MFLLVEEFPAINGVSMFLLVEPFLDIKGVSRFLLVEAFPGISGVSNGKPLPYVNTLWPNPTWIEEAIEIPISNDTDLMYPGTGRKNNKEINEISFFHYAYWKLIISVIFSGGSYIIHVNNNCVFAIKYIYTWSLPFSWM